jgi:NADH:ubiquinone oxidoreductase subunit H
MAQLFLGGFPGAIGFLLGYYLVGLFWLFIKTFFLFYMLLTFSRVTSKVAVRPIDVFLLGCCLTRNSNLAINLCSFLYTYFIKKTLAGAPK